MDAIANGGAGGNACSLTSVYGQMGGSGNPAGCTKGSVLNSKFKLLGWSRGNTNPTDFTHYGYGEDVGIEDKRQR